MLISHKHKFVFIHIPKTGGDSITAALKPFSEVVGDDLERKHLPAKEIRERFFKDRDWSSYLSFAVIRNPWEQIHSEWCFFQFFYSRVDELKRNGSCVGWLSEIERVGNIKFSDYVTECCRRCARLDLYVPRYCQENGKDVVKTIIKFDDLHKGFRILTRKLALNTQLPHENAAPDRPPYQEVYTPEMRKMVRIAFGKDIDRFNFAYDEEKIDVVKTLKRTRPNFSGHETDPDQWAINAESLDWLHKTIRTGWNCIETGCGWSTCVLLNSGGVVTSIDPLDKEKKIREWLSSYSGGDYDWHFIKAKSQEVVPSIPGSYDFVLVDGLHGFPAPTIDWYYLSRKLKVGGLLLLDDTQLWQVKRLAEFLETEEAWKSVWKGTMSQAFQLIKPFPENSDHYEQSKI